MVKPVANVTIEVYRAAYHQQVVDLILKIQNEEFGVPITVKQQLDLNEVEQFYQKDNGNFWVALYENNVVGTIALIDIGGRQVALRKMFVKKEFRGGIHQTGQRLMDTAIDWMIKRDCTEVFLGTLDIFQAAQRFYRRNGFQEIPVRSLPESFPRMKLDNTFFRKEMMPASEIRIMDYETIHQPWFEKFNRDWIETYFWMEPLDFEVLQYPDEHIINKGGFIFMASVSHEIAGTVALKYVAPRMYEFTKMAVDGKYRGKQIGRLLAEAAIRKARSAGAEKIILYSNTILSPAISLYRKLGFVEVPVDGPYKRSNIKMELAIS